MAIWSPVPRPRRRQRSLRRRARRGYRVLRRRFFPVLRLAVLAIMLVPPAWCALTAVVPVATTPTLLVRMISGQGTVRIPRAPADIAPSLFYAVIAAEDTRFCSHRGFDLKEIKIAQKQNDRRAIPRGASTISQQTVKNVFLWPARSWVRKAYEAYFTIFLEAFWPKSRIFATYLNVAEWGPGIYGAEAAARYHFGVSARHLTREQAARLAAILPNPRKWQANPPGPYVRSRTATILKRMDVVRAQGLATCVFAKPRRP